MTPPTRSPPSAPARTLTLVITELDPGGAENALVKLATGLTELGWYVDVVSLRAAGSLAADLKGSGIPVTPLHCGGLLDLRCYFRLRRHLKQQRPNVVLSFLHQANFYGRLAARAAGVPVVVSGIRVADNRVGVVWPDRLTRRLVTQYVACGESVATQHRRWCRIASERMAVIENGVDIGRFRGAVPLKRGDLGVPESAFLVMFVGRLTAQKGVCDLVSAFAALPDLSTSSWFLLLVGDGPKRAEIASTIASRRLPARLIGIRQDVPSLLKTADAVVIPSHWEGTPNVLLETLVTGTPVIAAAVDGINDIARRYPGVRCFESRNILELRDGLIALREQIADAGITAAQMQQLASEELTWSRMVESYDALLRHLLAAATV